MPGPNNLRVFVRVGPYNVNPETAIDKASVISHEYGHSLGLPDFYSLGGRETYGAGRYLDLEPDEDGTYAIDFNQAYHPSCVYAPQFSCPLTPAENRLATRVEAGERLAEGDAAH